MGLGFQFGTQSLKAYHLEEVEDIEVLEKVMETWAVAVGEVVVMKL